MKMMMMKLLSSSGACPGTRLTCCPVEAGQGWAGPPGLTTLPIAKPPGTAAPWTEVEPFCLLRPTSRAGPSWPAIAPGQWCHSCAAPGRNCDQRLPSMCPACRGHAHCQGVCETTVCLQAQGWMVPCSSVQRPPASSPRDSPVMGAGSAPAPAPAPAVRFFLLQRHVWPLLQTFWPAVSKSISHASPG